MMNFVNCRIIQKATRLLNLQKAEGGEAQIRPYPRLQGNRIQKKHPFFC
jgi:hypothetical protein